MIIRKHSVVFLAAALVLALAGTALAADNTVGIKSKEGQGSYLVDGKGMTLYYFKNDSPGKSVCAGPCIEKWPLFYIDTVAVPPELKAGDFGTITRDDGKKQTTYKGIPLYYFGGDKVAGDTKGQGVKDIWFVVQP